MRHQFGQRRKIYQIWKRPPSLQISGYLKQAEEVICKHMPAYFLHWNYIEMIFFFCFYFFPYIHFSLVQSLSCVQLFATPWTAAHQASLSFTISQFAQTRVHWVTWCHPTISSSVAPFSCPQSFPASGSFPMSRFFASELVTELNNKSKTTKLLEGNNIFVILSY